MEFELLRPRAFLSLLLLAFLLPCMNCVGIGFPALGNGTDRLALIAFKERISSDPLRVFSSWNDSHFCNWEGVICGRRHPQRVTALNLGSRGFVGPISPRVANLTFLRRINLSDNYFHGEIPREIGRLFRLRFLDLSHNGLQGGIPDELSNCSEIRSIHLRRNNLVGRIPVKLSSLSKLMWLDLSRNNLTGNIPQGLGNLSSSLITLRLGTNSLEGSIPDELGQLANLQHLQICSNKLSGMIPPSIYNLSSIVLFSLTNNRLHGNLPANLGLSLPNLKLLCLGKNEFTGLIPVTLPNASGLSLVEFAGNNFSGPVPKNLGRLQYLRVLNLHSNHLGGGEGDDDFSFLTSLTNCSLLVLLDLAFNNLKGSFPATIVNLSTNLIDLGLGGNPISGSIPTDISNLFKLISLRISRTFIMGTIPIGVGKLKYLQGLSLSRNRLSGQIPSSIGNITRLVRLFLNGNRFHGSIPLSLGNCHHLTALRLGRNKLNGTIPKEVVSIPSLIELSVGKNSLVGSLPTEVGNLERVQYLSVAYNRLMGEIPSTLGNCRRLETLDLSSNFFQGAIPLGLNNLTSIKLLNLSHNNLSGHIPVALEKFSFLEYSDLSSNDLDGKVPTQGIFKNSSAVSVLGNNKLCGGIPKLQLPACPKKAPKTDGRSASLRIIFSVIGAVLSLVLLSTLFVTLYRARRKSHKKPSSVINGQFLNVSYADLSKATGGFSSDNLIGVGGYGSVFKGILDRDETVLVAVKVLNLQQRGASRSFLAECETLRNIRHRNLVKIITACSSIDFKGNDFKALVFEYMPHGSLEKWLHPNVNGQQKLRSLNIIQRLDIAIDVASALVYLHHYCGTAVVHRDLKPSNVLLDDDMCAHVADFGLARFLSNAASTTSRDQTSSTGILGSVGYIPPEYGIGGKASTQGDVYSYGILLLEMLTGKRPTDDMFKDGLSLHQFVEMALPDQVMEIVDTRLLLEEVQAQSNGEERPIARIKMQECLASMAKIGIACSMESPYERMQMRDVAIEMHEIRESYLRVGIHQDQQNGACLLGQGSSYISYY